jgi:hypothetical protein
MRKENPKKKKKRRSHVAMHARINSPKYALCPKTRQCFGVELQETIVILFIRAGAVPA